MKVVLISLFVTFLASFVTSCGPGKSSVDREEVQDQKLADQKIAELKPVLGLYRGALTSKENGKIESTNVDLLITQVDIIKEVNSHLRRMPTLNATLTLGKPGIDIYFTLGDYQPRTKLLILTANSSGMVTTISAYFDGKSLAGELSGMNGALLLNLSRVEN